MNKIIVDDCSKCGSKNIRIEDGGEGWTCLDCDYEVFW